MKTIFLFLIISASILAQDRTVRQSELTDTLNARLATIGDSIAVAEMINDSLDARGFVNKTSIENISAQKNFRGTIPIKLNADSSIWLGGFLGVSPVGIRKYLQSADYPNYYSQIIYPVDTAETAEWSVNHLTVEWDEEHVGQELSYGIFYNNAPRKANKPVFGFAMEPVYEVPNANPSLSNTIYEWWYSFENKGVNPTYSVRPFQVGIFVPYSENPDSIRATMRFDVNELWMGTVDNPAFLDWQLKDTGLSYLAIQDTFEFRNYVNNQDWLLQGRAGGAGLVSLMKLDSLANVFIYPDNQAISTRFIRLGGGLIGNTDSNIVMIGNHFKANNGIGFMAGGSFDGGGLYYNKSENYFGMIGTLLDFEAEDWHTNLYNYPTNFGLGGNIGIGTKTFSGMDKGIAIGESDTPPTPTSNQSFLYTDNGKLNVMDATGNITIIGATNQTVNLSANYSQIYMPEVQDFLYASTSRFSVTDSNIVYNGADTSNVLYDNTISTFGIVVPSSVGKTTIDFLGKGELPDSLVYPGGYILVRFWSTYNPDSMRVRALAGRTGIWDTLGYEELSTMEGESLLRFTVPSTPNWVTKLDFTYYTSTDTCSPADIYYYLNRDAPTRTVVNKHQANTLYNKLSWKNFNNTEKASIDSNGVATFDSIETRIIDATEYYINGSPMSLGGAIGNADSLGSVPASGYLQNADSTQFRTFSDLKYAATASFAIAPALLDDSIAVKMNRSEMTGYTTDAEFETVFDTLFYDWEVMDTVFAQRLPGRKLANNITITEISAFTDAGTVTFNIEERAETTPNTAGTDAIGSDLVADTDQQETGTFSNANFDKNGWIVPVISSVSGEPTVFSIHVRYIKR